MNHAQYLAQANGHIAELSVQIVRQRVFIKEVLDTGQRSEMAESLLHALEESVRIFQKHRVLILGQLLRQPSDYGSSKRPDPLGANFDDANYTIGRNA